MLFAPAGEGKTAFVSVLDIAAVIAKLLTNDQYSKEVIELTGPTNYTLSEVASLLSTVIGKTIVYPNPDDATYKTALKEGGAPDFIADYMITVYSVIKNDLISTLKDNTEKITGRKAETLETVLRRDFK